MTTASPFASRPSPFSAKRILLVGAALLALAGTSYLLSCYALGPLALPTALFIAVAKASLVVVAFMEIARERVSIRLGAAAAVLMTLLLVGLVAADVCTREAPPLLPYDGHAQ